MGQTADQLRQELDQKRNELSRDVDHLQDRVKSTLDINRQIDQYPLLSVGVALLGGFLVGNLIGGGQKDSDTGRGRNYSTFSSYTPAYSGNTGYSAPTGGWAGTVSPSSYSQHDQSQSQHDQSQGQQYQPHGQHQDTGQGFLGGMTSGLSDNIRRGTSGAGVEGVMGNVTAALTALLVDKAKELLDQNLPGFSDRYEHLASTSRQTSSGQSGERDQWDRDAQMGSREATGSESTRNRDEATTATGMAMGGAYGGSAGSPTGLGEHS